MTGVMIISSSGFTSIHSSGTLSAYREYLLHLIDNQPQNGVIDAFAEGYHDYLQVSILIFPLIFL